VLLKKDVIVGTCDLSNTTSPEVTSRLSILEKREGMTMVIIKITPCISILIVVPNVGCR